ncbi:putative acetyltransferase [Hordeum vulgare]|nr:putative acetyltransferase [Hordeum vulgare]
MVKPDYDKSSVSPEPQTVHLTPWDLRRITVGYSQHGLLLPKPPPPASAVQHLASSFARALGRFYPLAGRFAVAPAASAGALPGLTISLRCGDEAGAEFVHAVAPGVDVSDISGPLRVIPRVVSSFFPLNGMLSTDAAVDPSRPLLAVQVTELADGVFVAMSLSHAAADGTTLWDLFNAWSEMSRSGDHGNIFSVGHGKRWFHHGCPVPIPLPFAKVEDMARRFECPPVQECSIHFSPDSIQKLKAKANADMAGTATATISSLQAVLAHLWRAVCRARELAPDRETRLVLPVGCRTRVKGIPQGYLGNAIAGAAARQPVGEILGDGRLGWTAWLLNRAVASVDEATVREELASWCRNPSLRYAPDTRGDPAMVVLSGSPRFDVYGNDFGWGRPLAVRTGPGNKLDGLITVFEDGGGAGGMELEVCLAPHVLAKLVGDQELMKS